MMRIVRRALRQWKREFLAFWGRFTAFHRIVMGIMLAMGIVFVARTRVLDPLESELEGLRKELSEKSIPSRIPEPEQDETVQEERLREESLVRSLENHEAALAETEAASLLRLDASWADANALLLDLASQHKLRLKKTPAESPGDGPVPTAASACELEGSYAAIYAFLDRMQREPLLWELRDVSIELLKSTDAFGGSVSPLLALRFTLVQHLYGGGR